MAEARDYNRLDDRTRYVGLKNIAARIGATPSQLRTLYDREYFPMLKFPNFRRFTGKPMRTIGPPETWYTEEWLVRWWFLKRLQRDFWRKRGGGPSQRSAGEKREVCR